eukprot:4466398-Alexandrium_andersonii.AAC.1
MRRAASEQVRVRRWIGGGPRGTHTHGPTGRATIEVAKASGGRRPRPVSYTHLTLPTICSV